MIKYRDLHIYEGSKIITYNLIFTWQLAFLKIDVQINTLSFIKVAVSFLAYFSSGDIVVEFNSNFSLPPAFSLYGLICHTWSILSSSSCPYHRLASVSWCNFWRWLACRSIPPRIPPLLRILTSRICIYRLRKSLQMDFPTRGLPSPKSITTSSNFIIVVGRLSYCRCILF